MAPILGLLFGEIAKKVFGKKADKVRGKVKATKGLIRSKTAKFATGSAMFQMGLVWVASLPEAIKWAATAFFFAQWAVTIWLRLKTKEPV